MWRRSRNTKLDFFFDHIVTLADALTVSEMAFCALSDFGAQLRKLPPAQTAVSPQCGCWLVEFMVRVVTCMRNACRLRLFLREREGLGTERGWGAWYGEDG